MKNSSPQLLEFRKFPAKKCKTLGSCDFYFGTETSLHIFSSQKCKTCDYTRRLFGFCWGAKIEEPDKNNSTFSSCATSVLYCILPSMQYRKYPSIITFAASGQRTSLLKRLANFLHWPSSCFLDKKEYVYLFVDGQSDTKHHSLLCIRREKDYEVYSV